MIVPNDAALIEQIIENNAATQFMELRKINRHRFGALRTIAPRNFRGDRLAIGDHVVDQLARAVNLNGAKMIGQRVAGGFAGLGH